MQSAFPIDVLLATYNGARFLAEQLDSLFAQSFQGFQIIVRDDASTDETVEIVESYRRKYPGRIKLSVNDARRGAAGNFMHMLGNETNSPYVMFSDQDDVWFPEKVHLSITEMRQLEERYGSQTPILVCTDQTAVNTNLETVLPSVWNGYGFRLRDFRFASMLARNKVAGCTVLINKALMQKALPMDGERIYMHDWWLALVASAFGILRPIFKPTMYYRQHIANAIGAAGNDGSSTLRQMTKNLFEPRDFRRQFLADLTNNRKLAKELRMQFGNELPKRCLGAIRTLEKMPTMNGMQARWSILKNAVFFPRIRMNVKVLLRY